jgi:ABC-2 type transport system ATP-binding protein
MLMIIIRDLTKSFVYQSTPAISKMKKLKIKKLALDNISLTIHDGEIFGLIGPIGAGKTTLIKILSTVILPDKGTATINNYDVVKDAGSVKRIIGVVSSEASRSFYWRLTGTQNIKFFASLYGMFGREAEKRLNYLFDVFDLTKWQDEMVMKYSTGMKQKLAFIRALLHNPPILLLDEPTSGMDALTSLQIRNYIRKDLEDKTILWTSHNLHEVEKICDRVAIINDGKIVLEGRPVDLKRHYWDFKKIILEVDKKNCAFFFKIEGAEIKSGNIIEIRTNDVSTTLSKISALASKKGFKIKHIVSQDPSLEDIFLEIMSHARGSS